MIQSTGFILFVLAIRSSANWTVGKQQNLIILTKKIENETSERFNFFSSNNCLYQFEINFLLKCCIGPLTVGLNNILLKTVINI